MWRYWISLSLSHSLSLSLSLALSLSSKMSESEIEILLEELGISGTESGGFPYVDIISYLVQAIEGTWQ